MHTAWFQEQRRQIQVTEIRRAAAQGLRGRDFGKGILGTFLKRRKHYILIWVVVYMSVCSCQMHTRWGQIHKLFCRFRYVSPCECISRTEKFCLSYLLLNPQNPEECQVCGIVPGTWKASATICWLLWVRKLRDIQRVTMTHLLRSLKSSDNCSIYSIFGRHVYFTRALPSISVIIKHNYTHSHTHTHTHIFTIVSYFLLQLHPEQLHLRNHEFGVLVT